MPVPTEAADERVPVSPSEGTPAAPAETVSLGSQEDDSGGATSPVDSLNETQTAALEKNSGDEKPAKIFIGGLSWQTTVETLKDFFEHNFGEVTECNIMRDQMTKKSRGFGFITFKETETVDKVLCAHAEEPIYIDDKLIDPKIAVPPKRVSTKTHVKRIFVGGLSSDTEEEDLRTYFEQFGDVTEAQLMFDRNTQRHRGFGFVSFQCEEPAEKVCSIQFHDIRGKKVEVKVAQTKEQMQSKNQGRSGINGRPSAPNYGYPVASFGPYYHGNYPFDMGMGYVPGPIMYPGMKMRGSRRGDIDYHGPAYYSGFVDQRAPPPNMHGYYTTAPPGGYSSIPIPHVMRGGQHFIEPQVIHNVDYITDHFQGMALNSGGGNRGNYGNDSPPYTQNITSYDTNNGGGYDATSSTSSAYSPTHTDSPTGSVPSTTANGYSQVPAFTGSPPNSYAVSY